MIKATNLIQTGIAWIPEIPSDWELKRIKLLFDFNKNIVGKTSADYDVLSLTTKGVIKRDIESGKGKFPASFDGYQIIKPNSIMLCLFDMDVTPRVVGHVDDDGIISAAYTNIIPKKDINAKYYYYYFLLQDKNKSLLALGTGIRITLNKDFFGTLKIPFPPIEVQNNIVAYLDKKNNEIDKFIRNKERLIEILEERKKDVIDTAFTKGLNPNNEFKATDIDWLTHLPKHWSLKRLKFLTKIISKGSTPSTEGREMTTEGIRFIKAENIYKSKVTEEPAFFIDTFTHRILKRSQLQENDLLFVIAGATIGKVAILSEEFLPANTNQAVSFIRLKKMIDVEFCYYWLHSNFITTNIWLKAVTSAQPNLAMEDLGNLSIPYPSDIEKEEIVKYVKKEHQIIDLAISKAQKEISSIKEYREALITDLVNGKRSVPQLQMS
jgi:type I restriction enzyme S subunit